MDYFTTLKSLGKSQGASLTAIAKAAGRSRTYIPSYISSKRNPSLAVANELAAPLGYGLALVPLDNVPDNALLIDTSSHEK